MRQEILELAARLSAEGTPFVLATVVWSRAPSSGKPSSTALITADGTLRGWLGGACAEPVALREALRALQEGTPRLLFLGTPAWAAVQASPYYSLYVNRLGGGEAKRAYYFPHDEVYDAGLREAIAEIAARAPWGSRLGHDAPGVVRFYLRRFGREDLVGVELSSPEFALAPNARPLYVIVQKGRRYFENQRWLDTLERRFRPILEVRVAGVVTTKVYEVPARGM